MKFWTYATGPIDGEGIEREEMVGYLPNQLFTSSYKAIEAAEQHLRDMLGDQDFRPNLLSAEWENGCYPGTVLLHKMVNTAEAGWDIDIHVYEMEVL